MPHIVHFRILEMLSLSLLSVSPFLSLSILIAMQRTATELRET